MVIVLVVVEEVQYRILVAHCHLMKRIGSLNPRRLGRIGRCLVVDLLVGGPVLPVALQGSPLQSFVVPSHFDPQWFLASLVVPVFGFVARNDSALGSCLVVGRGCLIARSVGCDGSVVLGSSVARIVGGDLNRKAFGACCRIPGSDGGHVAGHAEGARDQSACAACGDGGGGAGHVAGDDPCGQSASAVHGSTGDVSEDVGDGRHGRAPQTSGAGPKVRDDWSDGGRSMGQGLGGDGEGGEIGALGHGAGGVRVGVVGGASSYPRPCAHS